MTLLPSSKKKTNYFVACHCIHHSCEADTGEAEHYSARETKFNPPYPAQLLFYLPTVSLLDYFDLPWRVLHISILCKNYSGTPYHG
jgi:hypothetical protein